MLDLNEFQTRKQKIDILLKEQGWDVDDRSKIVLEVDTKQSDFKKQDYKQVNETRRNKFFLLHGKDRQTSWRRCNINCRFKYGRMSEVLKF